VKIMAECSIDESLSPQFYQMACGLRSMHMSGHGYTMVPHFLSMDQCSQLKSIAASINAGQWADIVFKDGKHNRTQCPFYWNGYRNGRRSPKIVPESILKDTDFVLSGSGYGMHTEWIKCSFLHSAVPCRQQTIHCDDPELSSASRKDKKFRDLSFNVIVALEPGTKLVFTRTIKGVPTVVEVDVPVGTAYLIRGDYLHAGAAYLISSNYRLFIGTGTDRFMNDGESVGLDLVVDQEAQEKK
jgi:hypothetical protein